MTLNFPNPSRSFDATGHRVRFWAYDNALEISFFVGVDALRKLIPGVNDTESQILGVFDSARTLIHEIASKVYSRGRRGIYTYTLAAEDF